MKKQRGLTLIELMISLALGLFVIGGVTYVTASTMRTNTDTLRSTHLNQELRAALQMMARDLRRAGYRFGIEQASVFTANYGLTLSATSGTGITLTPSDSDATFGDWMAGARIRHYSDGVSYCIDITTNSGSSAQGDYVECDASTDPTAFPSTSISAGTWTIQDANGLIETTATCISMGYDRDEVSDNTTGDGDIESDEQMGYAYDATDKALLVGSNDCSTGTSGWDALINADDSGINITGLDIDIIGDNEIDAGNASVRMLEIQLSLTGQLTTDSSVQRTVTEVVKIRNDQLI